ncbi:MAG TPA: nucleoside/nucleotide kinase family protein [Mycobacteriales bacterium]
MDPELLARARRLAGSGRRILGISGPPGSGKSTLAAEVVAAVGGVYVPMDGFHLAQAELVRLGRAGRKGAPDTFDSAGYVALLRRLRAREEEVVYAPVFDRHLEEAIAGSIPVPREESLVVTEGNYLLLDEGPWAAVRGLLDEAWYLDLDPDTRREGLVERHAGHGRTAEEARRWAHGSDERNAALVATTAGRADVRIDLDGERRGTVTAV